MVNVFLNMKVLPQCLLNEKVFKKISVTIEHQAGHLTHGLIIENLNLVPQLTEGLYSKSSVNVRSITGAHL